MTDFAISIMIALDHLCRYSLIVDMLYLGYVDCEMRLQESPKSLWLIEE